MSKKILIFLFCILLSSCVKREQVNGYSFGDLGNIDKTIAKIKIGHSNEIDVINLLGTPTAFSNFGPDTFFYIQRKSYSIGFLSPKLSEQKILEIVFDKNHTVQNVKQYNLSDASDLKYDQDEIDFKGNKLGVIEQFSKNIGRFKNKNTSKV